jgi:hypothetical protein
VCLCACVCCRPTLRERELSPLVLFDSFDSQISSCFGKRLVVSKAENSCWEVFDTVYFRDFGKDVGTVCHKSKSGGNCLMFNLLYGMEGILSIEFHRF